MPPRNKPNKQGFLSKIFTRNPHISDKQRSLQKRTNKANRLLKRGKLKGFFQPSKKVEYPRTSGFPTYDLSTADISGKGENDAAFRESLRKFNKANPGRVKLPSKLKTKN